MIGFSSAHLPLLDLIHRRLASYEEAISHANGLEAKYGAALRGFRLDPPSKDLIQRAQRTQLAFEAVLSHVDRVGTHLDEGFVVLPRHACGAANSLYRVPLSADDASEDRSHCVQTRSPILNHAPSNELSFRPYASNEVLLRSPILANSATLRTIAAAASDQA